MKKVIAIICAVTLTVGSLTVMADVNDGNNDGDMVTNPWVEVFTADSATGDTESDPTESETPKETPDAQSESGSEIQPTSSGSEDISGATETTTKGSDMSKVKAPKKAEIKKIYKKKKSTKKLRLKIKKIKNVAGYQIAIYKSKKQAKKNRKALVRKFVKAAKATIKAKKIRNRKKLFVRARAYVLTNKKTKLFGKWSKIKRAKVK